MKPNIVLSFLLAGCLCPASQAVPDTKGMKEGALNLKSAGPITFGDNGILFVADSASAAIFAVDIQDTKPAVKSEPLKIKAVSDKVAALLGTAPDQVLINDL